MCHLGIGYKCYKESAGNKLMTSSVASNKIIALITFPEKLGLFHSCSGQDRAEMKEKEEGVRRGKIHLLSSFYYFLLLSNASILSIIVATSWFLPIIFFLIFYFPSFHTIFFFYLVFPVCFWITPFLSFTLHISSLSFCCHFPPLIYIFFSKSHLTFIQPNQPAKQPKRPENTTMTKSCVNISTTIPSTSTVRTVRASNIGLEGNCTPTPRLQIWFLTNKPWPTPAANMPAFGKAWYQ